MLKRLVKKIKSFLYAIPFGMKAGDEILATSNKDIADGTSIQQKIQQKNVYAALLQGEVTQEVEELRWEMYKADELANDYKYVGNGQAIKIEESEEKKANRRLKFTQLNADIEYGLHESLNMAHEARDSEKMDYKTRKLFKITYDNPCVRFKLENYLEKVDINLKNGIKTSFYFIDNKSYKKLVPLVNELKKAKSVLKSFDSDDYTSIKTYVSKNELLCSMETMEFTTLNPTNNVPNGISYKFINPTLTSIEEKDDYVIMAFDWEKYEGGQLLSEKFHSESAEKKFKEKRKKENYAPVIDFSSIKL